MKFWLQLDDNCVIKDCIEYEHEGYIEVDLSLPLPTGLIAGYYRYTDGQCLLDEELKLELEQYDVQEKFQELE